ncbi:LytR/AlgR family response regulator transcription factor [Flavilitoribacter nigricans]|uniref:DNA-binding response regulator n=1 Tax=Flavilitoribacter nigricans (strain ATCC 23147 / DSM 23189 / NBRC 102662 / NCIMB 1420 / SS-2) TaxID=1122177 RepID=A0A2D0NFP6_FLAN2|nr:LytTR family DNA-binding domain-containing protein [Flavilitoribacter nigricans]PHN07210.1 DNA-binding response regulator [Flavilitoribacter nigricans DSM 23189 = NBRC 102662]
MLKTIILEDEANNLAYLQDLLAEYCPNVEVVGTATSVADGLRCAVGRSFDLALLDVELKDGSAFDWLTQLPATDFHLIFITAYDHYAIQAIRHSAIDYLLKPIQAEDLTGAIGKVKARQQEHEENSRLRELLHNLEAEPEEKRLAIPQKDKIEFILIRDIIRCQGDGNYTHILLPDRKITVAKTLREYEELLSAAGFVRIHQSHLVQIRCIAAYYKQEGGYLKLRDGTRLSVSRHRREYVLERLREVQ